MFRTIAIEFTLSAQMASRLVHGDENFKPHDGPGWYYTLDDYPEDGSCGAFETETEAKTHASKSGLYIGARANSDETAGHTPNCDKQTEPGFPCNCKTTS